MTTKTDLSHAAELLTAVPARLEALAQAAEFYSEICGRRVDRLMDAGDTTAARYENGLMSGYAIMAANIRAVLKGHTPPMLTARVASTFEAEADADPRNLRDLLESMRTGRTPGDLWDDLPTFGGRDIEHTLAVWSWDATHAIVGTCADDLNIVPRSEVE